MSFGILLIEMLIFASLFTVMVFYVAMKRKNTPSNIHNYPPEIQEEYFKTHERVDTSYQSKNVLLTKSFGIVLFTIVLYFCAKFAGAKNFWEGFLIAFLLMIWIGIYDTCFIDWVLFSNMKVFRLEGTEHMDEAYHQKMFHLKGMIFPGIIFALIPALVVGCLILIL